MKVALWYLSKLQISPDYLQTYQIFSSTPYQKDGSKELIYAAKHGKVN